MEQLISVRSLFKETDAYAGKQIKVGGWVRNLRASKNFGFINLSDGTFFSQVQVVYGSELANFAEISKLNIDAVTGSISFDANGDAIKSTAYIKQAIDGGFQFYKVQNAD